MAKFIVCTNCSSERIRYYMRCEDTLYLPSIHKFRKKFVCYGCKTILDVFGSLCRKCNGTGVYRIKGLNGKIIRSGFCQECNGIGINGEYMHFSKTEEERRNYIFPYKVR